MSLRQVRVSLLASMFGFLSVGAVPAFATSALQFVSVMPCRVADTRNMNGTFGGPAIAGDTERDFPIPQSACNIPSSAAAYSLNVTVVPHGTLGYLTVWPTGEQQPLVSTLNSIDGRIKANAAIVPAGTQGAVSFYVTDTTDLVLDIDGYFTPSSNSTLAFYPLSPCRVADTRNAPGDLGGPYLLAGVPRDFSILEANSCNIPSTAQAYSMNFTAVPRGPLGYLTVWPTGQSQPYVSTLNAPTGTVTANAAIVPAGNGGEISAFAFNDTDLIIDIDGYFAVPGQGGMSLYPLTPCRVLDTRPPLGNGPFQATLSPPVDVVGSSCGIPSQSQAYVFNATVVPPGSLGYLTLWPDGGSQPYVSTLNAYDGTITSNMAIVPAGSGGKIDAYAYNLTDLILDISSYFAPGSSLSIATNILPIGFVNYVYLGTLSPLGGTPPYTWNVIGGTLPAGLTLGTNGVITGTPTAPGTVNLGVQVQDALGQVATGTVNLGINSLQTFDIATSQLPDATVNSLYNTPALTATGGSGSISWSIVGGSLPPGLALNAATGVISGTPNTPGIYTFTAQAQDQSLSLAYAQFGIAVSTSLPQISALLANPAAPLTPLQINTSSLNPKLAATVTFSDGNGFSVTEQPIRITSDGTIVVPVPIYISSQTLVISQGIVEVTISQSGLTSPPVQMTIQQLPTNADYGTSLGQITHAFFQYQAMKIGRRIGELQAFQALPGNTVDTSNAQTELNAQLLTVIEARDDFDRVALNPSLVITAGTMPDGTVIQFDHNSLEIMDRIIGVYLTTQVQQQALMAYERALSKRSKGSPLPLNPFLGYQYRAGNDQFLRLMTLGSGRHRLVRSKRHELGLAPTTISQLLGFITTAGNLTGLAQAFSDAFHKQDQTELDGIMSVGAAVVSLNALAQQAGAPKIPILPALLGSIVSGYGLLQNFGMELGDLAFIMTAADGTDPQVLADAYKDIQDQGNAAWGNFIGTELSLAELGVQTETFGPSVVQWMESNLGQLTLQSAGLVAGAYSCATGDPPCYQDELNATLNAASEVTSLFGSVTQGFAEITGDAQVSYTGYSDPLLDPLSGISLSPLDFGQVTGVADPSGAFDMFVPLDSPNTDYTNLSVAVFDPISDLTLASEPVDLSSLTTAAPMQVPDLQGTCDDTDSGDPDGDDPDCD